LCEREIESFPEEGGLRAALAVFYAEAGRREDALRVLEWFGGGTDLMSRGARAGVLSMLGYLSELESVVKDFDEGKIGTYLAGPAIAVALVRNGDKERAFDFLERDFREGDRLLWNFYQDPGFDPVRGDPRFVHLLQAMKLPTTLRRDLEGRPIGAKPAGR